MPEGNFLFPILYEPRLPKQPTSMQFTLYVLCKFILKQIKRNEILQNCIDYALYRFLYICIY